MIKELYMQLSIFFSNSYIPNEFKIYVPVNMTYRYMYAVYMQHVPSDSNKKKKNGISTCMYNCKSVFIHI